MKKLIFLITVLAPFYSTWADEYVGPKCRDAQVGDTFYIDRIKDLYRNTPEFLNRDPNQHSIALVRKEKNFTCHTLSGVLVGRFVANEKSYAPKIDPALCNSGAIKNNQVLRLQDNIDVLVFKQGSKCHAITALDYGRKCSLGSQRELLKLKNRQVQRKLMGLLNSARISEYVNAFDVGTSANPSSSGPRQVKNRIHGLCSPSQVDRPQKVYFTGQQIEFTSKREKSAKSDVCQFSLDGKDYSCDKATVRLMGKKQFIICESQNKENILPVSDEAKSLMQVYESKINDWAKEVCPSGGAPTSKGGSQSR